MKVLIAGSMVMKNAGIIFAKACVRWALERGHTVVVGDNPLGVDKAVISECDILNVPHEVYWTEKLRYSRRSSLCYKVHVADFRGRHTLRDRHMCELADIGIFIWNGDSHGTLKGYDYMKSLGKDAHLRKFK